MLPNLRVQQVIVQRAGETTFLIWNEQTDSGARIRIGPLTSAGAVDVNRVIELPHDSAGALAPSAASSGDEILVVWYVERLTHPQEETVYLGARISSAGVLLDPFPLILGSSAAPGPPHVAWSGSRFVVTWLTSVVMVTPDGVTSPQLPLETGVFGPGQAFIVDIGQTDGHALLIAQGMTIPGSCHFFHCVPATGPEVDLFLFDADGVWGPVVPSIFPPGSNILLAIGPAPGGFVIAWIDSSGVYERHLTAVNGAAEASDEPILAVPGFFPGSLIRAANDLIAWNSGALNSEVDSSLGRLSLDGENAFSPDILWLGGDRYLVAYLVMNGDNSHIELLTIDVSGRRRAVR